MFYGISDSANKSDYISCVLSCGFFHLFFLFTGDVLIFVLSYYIVLHYIFIILP